MSEIFAELGLGLAFTLIALAPMVPEWLNKNDGPTISVKIMAGIPSLTPEELSDPKKMNSAYNRLSFGGSTPIVTLFNVNGNRLAYKLNDGGKDTIGHGSMKELHATYHIQGDNQKPEYIIVQSSGIDAICIAAVTVTHPTSSDTYAFLPGEVGKVCGDWDPDNDYAWSNSGAVVQFKGPEGNTAEARPKCMWIDSADNKNVAATSWKGFQVHLPDFKMDNSKFKAWEGDPYHMCGSKARFGVYKALNEYMCPQVFETPPAQGALLPLPEVSTCVPGVAPDKSGKFEVNICKDGRLDAYGKNKLFQSFGRQPRAQCKGNRAAKERRRLDLSQKFSEANKSAIQKRFTGQLIKSRDSGQSAVETCNSRNSIGPNFYSYHEGQLCDMERRKLYPRCEASDETECFDELLNETRHTYEKRGEKVVHTAVEEWA